jgi:hypothetical protein
MDDLDRHGADWAQSRHPGTISTPSPVQHDLEHVEHDLAGRKYIAGVRSPRRRE